MFDATGKRLLVLGGAVQCCKVVKAAKRMGAYTIVTDIDASRPMREIADEILPYSVKDVEGITQWCEGHSVDGILNLCIDAAQKTQQRLCERFGFPCYGDSRQVLALTNKAEFTKACLRYGVDVIPKYDAGDIELGNLEYPVLVKPAESSGSRGLAICNTPEELSEAIVEARRRSNNGECVVERYMGDSQDFTMSYFVIEGTPYLYCTHDRYLGTKESGLDRQCVCQYGPSKYLDMYLRHVDEKVKGMIQGIGIETGPVFFQGFVDGEKLRVYDPGIRFPGTEYETAYAKAMGFDLMEMIVEFALGGNIRRYAPLIDGSHDLSGMRTASLFVDCRPGVIGSFEGLDKVREIPEVTCVSQKAFVGRDIPASGDVKQRVCEVTLLFEDDSKYIAETIRKVQSLIKVCDEHGESMIVSPFDANLVRSGYGN